MKAEIQQTKNELIEWLMKSMSELASQAWKKSEPMNWASGIEKPDEWMQNKILMKTELKSINLPK